MSVSVIVWFGDKVTVFSYAESPKSGDNIDLISIPCQVPIKNPYPEEVNPWDGKTGAMPPPVRNPLPCMRRRLCTPNGTLLGVTDVIKRELKFPNPKELNGGIINMINFR